MKCYCTEDFKGNHTGSCHIKLKYLGKAKAKMLKLKLKLKAFELVT